MRDIIIIGGGPAGYTAAIYAARASLYPLVLEGGMPGGMLTTTTTVENFPGFPEGVDGPELMSRMADQARRFGAKLETVKVTSVDFSSRPFRVSCGDRTEEAKAVIIATGGRHRQLGVPSEEALKGKGVSYCATCDAFFFRGKTVAVVGGGDSAIEEADFISRFAEKVYLLVRRDVFRASKAMQDRAFGNRKIEVIWNVLVDDVLGAEEGRVTGVRIRGSKDGTVRELACQGVFPVIGHDPNTAIFAGQVELDEAGYVRLSSERTTATSVPGVFVAGDVDDSRYRQAITAAGEGCRAALDALHFLEDNPV
ncbi:thioredoxin-disulfide reductase [Candidatus Uhrbacteria bacterium]|nr:thioredoxin-disulfide reductase [Candidatus Uhrbacteria bacterium]